VITALKCVANVSDRVAMRRRFLSQPISRPTTLRLRYCSRPKAGLRPALFLRCSSWYFRSGVTARAHRRERLSGRGVAKCRRRLERPRRRPTHVHAPQGTAVIKGSGTVVWPLLL
jgi:hypothetical protein